MCERDREEPCRSEYFGENTLEGKQISYFTRELLFSGVRYCACTTVNDLTVRRSKFDDT